MALIVFFRGINVGGHRTFRPSMLARELRASDVVNVGAAGTLIVRKPGSRAKFLAELRRKLPFEAEVAFCDGSDLIRLEMENPFGAEPSRPDIVRFVSILSKDGRSTASLPIALPASEDWFVRIIGSKNRLVFGVYRRHMKTIGYLGRIDELFGAPATTRSWSTILSVLRILKAYEPATNRHASSDSTASDCATHDGAGVTGNPESFHLTEKDPTRSGGRGLNDGAWRSVPGSWEQAREGRSSPFRRTQRRPRPR